VLCWASSLLVGMSALAFSSLVGLFLHRIEPRPRRYPPGLLRQTALSLVLEKAHAVTYILDRRSG
jgi:hypothetical protein